MARFNQNDFFWFDFNLSGVLIYKWCNWFPAAIGFSFSPGTNGLNRLNRLNVQV